MMNLFHNNAAPGDLASLESRTINSGTIFAPNDAFAGVKLDNDGLLYERKGGSVWTRPSWTSGHWLNSGSAATFYASRTLISGTLTTDAGAGPLILSTDRIYDVQVTGTGNKVCIVDIDISDDVSGTPVIASARYTLEAEVEPTG